MPVMNRGASRVHRGGWQQASGRRNIAERHIQVAAELAKGLFSLVPGQAVPEELACKKEIVEPTWSSLSGLLLDKRVAKQIVKFFSFGCANPTQPSPSVCLSALVGVVGPFCA